MEITLKAQARTEAGKGAARKFRQSGRVPAVLYGRGMDPLALSIETKDMTKALHTEAGHNVLINLQVDPKTKYLTMLREIQKNPVRGNLIHIDFLKIDRDVKIQADVPIHLVGDALGVKEGGVVEHHLWEVKIEALPGDVPPHIDLDLTHVGLGQHRRVSDLKLPDSVELLTPLEEIIVSIVEPQVIKMPEEVAAEEAAAAEAAAAAEEGAGEEAAPSAEAEESPES